MTDKKVYAARFKFGQADIHLHADPETEYNEEDVETFHANLAAVRLTIDPVKEIDLNIPAFYVPEDLTDQSSFFKIH